MAGPVSGKTPILLLKTKSTPTDTYEEYFHDFEDNQYDPTFVPVLEHRFKRDALNQVRHSIINGDFVSSGTRTWQKYGAIIFTSQRAVEGFSQVIASIRSDNHPSLDSLLPESVPFYVVGPATARGVRALNLPCPILGEETGNGDALAAFILEHYNGLHQSEKKPAILFLVGEKRRDIIPKTLQSEEHEPQRRSEVHELEVYETGEMYSFKNDFTSIWSKNFKEGRKRQWVVVFSPTGCEAMLESLGLFDLETRKAKSHPTSRDILVATIGPTTRDYLIKEFGFTPDVCAEKPSPEGIGDGILSFKARVG